jgi:methionine-rich copper-binding protein CopC
VPDVPPKSRRARVRARLVATAALAIALATGAVGGAHAVTLYPPGDNVVSGVSVEFPPKDNVPAFNQLTGQPNVALVNVFTGQQESLFDAIKPVLWLDSAPMVSWRMTSTGGPGSTTTSIAAGDVDTYLAQSAATIAAYPRAVYLRPMWEFNGNWYNWSMYDRNGNARPGTTPASYVNAWKRAHIIFQGGSRTQIDNKLAAEGLPAYTGPGNNLPNADASWVWSLAKAPIRKPSGAPEVSADYYPGDAYVDWVGSGFHDTRCNQDVNWWINLIPNDTDPLGRLGELIKFANDRGKPVMLTEWAVSSPAGDFGCGDNPKWINDTASMLLHNELIDVDGHIYFNRRTGGGGDPDEEDNNHLLELDDPVIGDHKDSLAAYRNYVANGKQTQDWTELQGVPNDNQAPAIQKVESLTSGNTLTLNGPNVGIKEAQTTRFRLFFSEAVAPSSVSAATMRVESTADGEVQPYDWEFPAEEWLKVYRLNIAAPLSGGRQYQIVVDGLKDVHGNAMARKTIPFTVDDVTPPTVTSSTPANGQQDASTSGDIVIRFSEPVQGNVTNASAVQVLGPGGTPLPAASRTLGANGRTVTIDLQDDLAPATTYTVILSGGIKDLEGNSLGQTPLSFTTAAPPPPAPPAPPPAAPAASPGPIPEVAGAPAAPTAGAAVCNPIPNRGAGKKGTIRLTKQALVIQQRIDAAALRRLNAANDWIDQGIVPTDLCAGAFGQSVFAGGVPWAGGGAAQAASPPDPRPLKTVTKNKKPGTFTVNMRQVRINDTISRALLARAQATAERIDSLTGGNLAPGASLRGRPLYPGLTTSGALPGTGDAAATPLSIGKLPPAGKLRVNVAQLKKTQQRSQQAIILANRVNDRIEAGLTEDQFKAGSIGAGRLS